jgi:hypothetical protein
MHQPKMVRSVKWSDGVPASIMTVLAKILACCNRDIVLKWGTVMRPLSGLELAGYISYARLVSSSQHEKKVLCFYNKHLTSLSLNCGKELSDRASISA